MTTGATPKRKRGRIAWHLGTARDVAREPRLILGLTGGWLLNLWRLKGGGFYGLGYVVAFVTYEIGSLTGDVGESESVGDFIANQAVQYVIRFSIESLINAFRAMIWPLDLVLWLEVWGLVILVVGFVAFRYAVRPIVEARFPELKKGGEAE